MEGVARIDGRQRLGEIHHVSVVAIGVPRSRPVLVADPGPEGCIPIVVLLRTFVLCDVIERSDLLGEEVELHPVERAREAVRMQVAEASSTDHVGDEGGSVCAAQCNVSCRLRMRFSTDGYHVVSAPFVGYPSEGPRDTDGTAPGGELALVLSIESARLCRSQAVSPAVRSRFHLVVPM